jgi:hypothetical protein
MIKIKALRRLANDLGYKLSASTTIAELDRIIRKVVSMACTEAGKQASPKLEGRHFEGIEPYKKVNNLDKALRLANSTKVVKKKARRV